MSKMFIAPATTVREVMTRHPSATVVFAKHGLTGCGGPRGPIEPIGFFAKVHNVDPDELVRELNEHVASQPETPPAETATAEKPSPEIYRVFVKSAMAIALTVGCTLGAISLAQMALSQSTSSTWPALTEAHGIAQIFGWVGLFIMGITYHVLPKVKSTTLSHPRAAMASFWLVLAGTLLRMLAPWAEVPALSAAPFVSALLSLTGVTIFAQVAWATLRSNPAAADFYDKYIVASIVWFWVWSATTLALAIYTPAEQIAQAVHNSYLFVALMGFATMMIFGFTLRTIPAFMGLRTPNKAAFGAIFWALNAAIVLRPLTAIWTALDPASIARVVDLAAGVVEYAAVVAFVVVLGLFGKPRVDLDEAGPVRGYERFVKAAYLWLLLAATLSLGYLVYRNVTGSDVPHALVGAYRHALTVGFISMMIVGMASRIIPVFSGNRLHSPGLLLATFILLNTGNTIRVAAQPLSDFVGGPLFAFMGVSGFIEVSALAVFAYNILRTMEQRHQAEGVEPSAAAEKEPTGFAPNSIVGDIVDAYPQTLAVFARHGFVHLQDEQIRRTMARSVTVAMASRMHGVDQQQLLADLNAVVAC